MLDLQLYGEHAQGGSVLQSTLLAVEFVGEACAGRKVLIETLFDMSASGVTSWKGSEVDLDVLFWLPEPSPDTSRDQILQSLLDKQDPGGEPDRLMVDARLVEVIDSYQLFRDCELYREQVEQVSPWRNLRLLMSQNHSCWGHGWVLPPHLNFPRAVLRLACFECPLMTRPGRRRNFPVKPTYFDLSTQLTTRLTDSWSRFVTNHAEKCTTLSGTLQEREFCQESIVQETWENANCYLDAWGQLYLLANVKKWFSSFWRIDEPNK